MNEMITVSIEGDISEQDLEKLQEMAQQMEELKQVQLEQFASAIAKYRDEAVQGRKASGIEQIWLEDEEAYAGVDDANRDEEVNSKSILSKSAIENNNKRTVNSSKVKSTAYVNITRPYCDGAAARVGDMLLPTDGDSNYDIESTSIPEEVQAALDGKFGPEFMAQVEEAKNIMDMRLDGVKVQISDWLEETNYSHECREAVDDCARVGTGVVKGPIPENRITRTGTEIKPASKHVDYFNLYPDPACGNNIQNGKYLFERDTITVKGVRELIGEPGYLEEQIDAVLKEGPNKKLIENPEYTLSEGELYEIWYFHGAISRSDMENCECDIEGEDEIIDAVVTMINDHVVHVSQYHVDNKDFPYDVMCWQKRTNHWAGIGVSRQMRTPQRMLNAATRNMMDNAGISAGPQIIRFKDVIKPADGSWDLYPNKQWIAEPDADVAQVQNAFMAVVIPSLQGPLQEIIHFALKMAEDITGLPQLMQGNQGSAPDTVGGMTILNNNANVVLRRIARAFDINITIPHIQRYYDWLITHEGADTDYKIVARGSSTLVERDLQNQAILQMGQMVLNPAFGVRPDLWMEEYLKSLKFDPKRFKGEEQQQDAEKQEMMQQLQAMQQELESRTQEKQMEMEYKYASLDQEREIALMKLALDENIKFSELQAKLGIESMKRDDGSRQQVIENKLRLIDAKNSAKREDTHAKELEYKRTTGNQGI